MKRVLLLAAVVLLAACGSDSNESASTTATDVTTTVEAVTTAPSTTGESAPTTTAVSAEPLQILVTNDDGVDAPGIDALVNALVELPDVEVTVYAPAENQSGTSMNLTEGELTATEATTASGYPVISVMGFPADSVAYALANDDTEFDLVVSGSNSGQNIGDFSALSGTVGAARYAAQQGIPAVAVSQGIADNFDFAASVGVAIDWITEHRADYEAGTVSLWSINGPTCPNGTRGPIEVPLADAIGDRNAVEVACDSQLVDPVDDVDAFINGFVSISELPITL